jgi:hypothetical protein
MTKASESSSDAKRTTVTRHAENEVGEERRTNEPEAPLLCPSSHGGEGAILLGVFTGGGSLTYVTPKHRVDEEFLRRAGPRPEERFRFSRPCIEGRCDNWSEGRCGLIARLSDAEAEKAKASTLPACSIRAHCRWFKQKGRDACSVCPLVRYPINRSS